MKSYSTSELVRSIGEVTHTAATQPVLITHHAKPRYVLMSFERYERMTATPEDPRRVYGAGEAPPELARALLAALDRTIEELASGDGD
ncbi:MAG TPA: type II toxin-antitoxin system prevent-host-death family antitoxin [Caulobacteraceae bacterium]|nr:type II toxin-antitoxin system prevent-host-death family antitoxin [Caulobacteraceae bacterium]